MSDYAIQSQAAGRHLLPDLVRAFALFGICVVNVAYFAWPGTLIYHYGGLNTGLDYGAFFGVNALFLFKSYTLFSFMFGAGLAYQMMSAERRGSRFGPEYYRRMLGLFLIGLLHVTFGFVGDILIIYAIIGCLFFVFRNCKIKTLLIWAWILIGLQLLFLGLASLALWAGEAFAPEEMKTAADEMMDMSAKTLEDFLKPGLPATIQARWTEWMGFIGYGFAMQGPGVLGYFLLGLAAVKAKRISDPGHNLWRKGRVWGLPLGLLISATGAWLYTYADSPITARAMFGMTLIALGSPLSSWGYVGWLAKWASGGESALRTFLARAGTASLSAYLVQSLILSLVFVSYGLGLYGQLGAAACISISVLAAIASLIFVSLWRKRFARGPVEHVLRSFTYLGSK